MKRLVVEVTPLDSGLLLGGRSDSTRGADDATARDAQGRLILPATALRGALRIELERLLRGRGHHACSATASPGAEQGAAGAGTGAAGAELDAAGTEPNAAAAEPAPPTGATHPPATGSAPAAAASDPPSPLTSPCACPVCRLFGTEGVGTGTLRLEDARLDGEERTVELRPRIAVSRKTGTVAHRLLAFAETGDVPSGQGACFRAAAWLVPRSAEELGGDVLEQDRAHLAAACRALTGLGGGKSRGLGWVECELKEAEAEADAAAAGAATGTTTARPTTPTTPAAGDSWRVRFVTEAPLHLGDGRPIAYFHPTLRHAPASVVRGALAFALLEQGLCTAEDAGFQAMFGPQATVRFGAARRPGHVPSATRRQCRPDQHGFDDLVGEVLRREAAARRVALAPRPEHACPHPGCRATKITPAVDGTAHDDVRVRVHTRTAINRRTGTSMDKRLFSVELLEPWLRGTRGERGAEDPAPLVLEAELRDVSAETSALLARLHGKHASLGGKRSQGMGRCRLETSPATAPAVEPARAAVADLDRELRAAWRGLVAAVDGLSGELAPADERPVAVVLTEPWAVDAAAAERLAKGPLGRKAGHAFLLVEPQGRFGAVEAQRWKAGEHVKVGEIPPSLVAAPGSTWLYWIEAAELERELPGWVAAGGRGAAGVGEGRYRIRGPLDPATETAARNLEEA